jgi:hypothetical protein
MPNLWNRVKIVNNCWEYQGHRHAKGYGTIRIGSRKDGSRRMEQAHRFAWMKINGDIPDGLCVLHHCDNPSCVKPGHLFLGTNQDNMTDMVNKGRSRKSRGVLNPSAKLTIHQVMEIKKRLKTGESPTSMANDYPVSRNLLYAMRNGDVWNHIQN